jgi:hypothetical protein
VDTRLKTKELTSLNQVLNAQHAALLSVRQIQRIGTAGTACGLQHPEIHLADNWLGGYEGGNHGRCWAAHGRTDCIRGSDVAGVQPQARGEARGNQYRRPGRERQLGGMSGHNAATHGQGVDDIGVHVSGSSTHLQAIARGTNQIAGYPESDFGDPALSGDD